MIMVTILWHYVINIFIFETLKERNFNMLDLNFTINSLI